MTIIGVDIGTTKAAPCALALYEPHGDRVLCTRLIPPSSPTDDIDARIGDIGAGIMRTLDEWSRWQPCAICYERAHINKNAQTGLKLAAMCGAVVMIAHRCGMAVVGVQPSAAKVALCGYPGAEKADMILAAQRQYTLTGLSSHEADAIGIALAGWAVYRLAHMPRVAVVG